MCIMTTFFMLAFFMIAFLDGGLFQDIFHDEFFIMAFCNVILVVFLSTIEERIHLVLQYFYDTVFNRMVLIMIAFLL